MIWVGTWRHNFIMDYEIMKLDVAHWSLSLVFLSATWFDTLNISYLSLLPLTVAHLGGNCSWLQLHSTWCYSSIVIWINTWWHNFIMEYEIMKLYVGHYKMIKGRLNPSIYRGGSGWVFNEASLYLIRSALCSSSSSSSSSSSLLSLLRPPSSLNLYFVRTYGMPLLSTGLQKWAFRTWGANKSENHPCKNQV